MTDEEAMKCRTATEAKKYGLKHYFTGKPCNKGHIGQRLTSNRQCCLCFKNYYEKNLETVTLYKKEYRKKNTDRIKVWNKEGYEKKKDERKQKMKNYAAKNMPRILEIQAKRKAAKKLRVPIWLTKDHREQIVYLYLIAKQIKESTGVDHHVDHIVPIQGKTVSGLHVPWNMQVISAKENREKKNYYWPDMWEKGLT